MRTWLRIFFVGGAISFRALFSWIRPSVYIPTLLLGPTTQIIFFAYLGRTAHLESDDWFVVGNAVQSASLAALFGMGFAIDGERWTQTLSAVLATPASRAALFLGRSGPVLVNAAITAATGFVGAAIFLDFRMPWSSVPAILFLLLVASYSCTGLGMVTGAVGLRMFFALFILYATRYLDVGAATLGVVLGIASLGAVAGSFVTGRIGRRIGIGPTFLLGCLLFPLPLVLVPAAGGPYWLVLACLFVAEFTSGVGLMMLDIMSPLLRFGNCIVFALSPLCHSKE